MSMIILIIKMTKIIYIVNNEKKSVKLKKIKELPRLIDECEKPDEEARNREQYGIRLCCVPERLIPLGGGVRMAWTSNRTRLAS